MREPLPPPPTYEVPDRRRPSPTFLGRPHRPAGGHEQGPARRVAAAVCPSALSSRLAVRRIWTKHSPVEPHLVAERVRHRNTPCRKRLFVGPQSFRKVLLGRACVHALCRCHPESCPSQCDPRLPDILEQCRQRSLPGPWFDHVCIRVHRYFEAERPLSRRCLLPRWRAALRRRPGRDPRTPPCSLQPRPVRPAYPPRQSTFSRVDQYRELSRAPSIGFGWRGSRVVPTVIEVARRDPTVGPASLLHLSSVHQSETGSRHKPKSASASTRA